MEFFKTDDGVKLAYTDRGKGKCVVLIAGYRASAVTWCCQEKALLKAGYRVICFDRRSHGASDNPPFGQNMLRQGQDINCLMEHLDLREAVLVGMSQGASSIFSYISQFGTSRLAGICDIDQTPKMMNDDGWSYGMYDLNAETRPTYFDTPLGNPSILPVDKRITANVWLHSLVRKKYDMECTRPLLLSHADADWLPVLRSIDIPVFFVAGQKSPRWPSEHAEASSSYCKNGAFAVVKGAGHTVNWEDPDTFNELLLQFLSTMPTWGRLEGNGSEYASEVLVRQAGPLSGKHILFLGSSVTNGAGSCCDSFVDMLVQRDGIAASKQAVNGTTLVDVGPTSYLKRLRALDSSEHYDAFVCQLSTNDAARGFSKGDVAEAIENIVSYVKNTFCCPILFYTSPKFDSPAYADMVTTLRSIADADGFGVIDLWSECDMSALSEKQKSLYFADPIHPTRAGYAKIFVPAFEKKLKELFTE